MKTQKCHLTTARWPKANGNRFEDITDGGTSRLPQSHAPNPGTASHQWQDLAGLPAHHCVETLAFPTGLGNQEPTLCSLHLQIPPHAQACLFSGAGRSSFQLFSAVLFRSPLTPEKWPVQARLSTAPQLTLPAAPRPWGHEAECRAGRMDSSLSLHPVTTCCNGGAPELAGEEWDSA